MKLFVITVLACVAVAVSGDRPGRPGGHHHGPRPGCEGHPGRPGRDEDIRLANTFEKLLKIASEEGDKLDEQLKEIQSRFRESVKAQQANDVLVIQGMNDGPAECNKANEVQSLIDSREMTLEEQTERNIVSEIKNTPEVITHINKLHENVGNIIDAVQDNAKSTKSNRKGLQKLKRAVSDTRRNLQKAVHEAEKAIYATLKNEEFLSIIKDFQVCYVNAATAN